MSGLSQDQIEKRAAIHKGAMVLGGIVGAIAGLLALWILGGQSGVVRFGGAIVVALGLGFLVFRANFKSKAKSALCESCGAAFSRSRSDHKETVTGSDAKEEQEEQPDGSIKVTNWTEDSLDVVDTYTCAKCGENTTKAYQTTRRRDETTSVKPVEAPKAAAKSKKEDAPKSVARKSDDASGKPKPGRNKKK